MFHVKHFGRLEMAKSKKFFILIFVFVLCVAGGLYYAYQEANIIFPVDEKEVVAVTIREYNDGLYQKISKTLVESQKTALIAEMNHLQPVWNGERLKYVVQFPEETIQYEIVLRYDQEKSKLRRESVAHIYFADNGNIIADCGGYLYFQAESEDCDAFIAQLKIYAEECLVQAE